MKKDIEQLINEITDSTGFLNITKDDINEFVSKVHSIEGIKTCGSNSDSGRLLEEALEILQERNKETTISHLLIAIRYTPGNELLMTHMDDISKVLGKCSENVEYVWGLSETDKIKGSGIELIVLAGWK